MGTGSSGCKSSENLQLPRRNIESTHMIPHAQVTDDAREDGMPRAHAGTPEKHRRVVSRNGPALRYTGKVERTHHRKMESIELLLSLTAVQACTPGHRLRI